MQREESREVIAGQQRAASNPQFSNKIQIATLVNGTAVSYDEMFTDICGKNGVEVGGPLTNFKIRNWSFFVWQLLFAKKVPFLMK